MDVNLSEDARVMQSSTREVVNDLLKHESTFHESGEVPERVHQTRREVGYYGLTIPEEYGGTNVDKVTSALVQLELARMRPQFWPSIRTALGPIPQLLLDHGREEQKNTWLPAIAEGTQVPCFALTGPGAGSDVASITTTAVRNGGTWVVNGASEIHRNMIAKQLFQQ